MTNGLTPDYLSDLLPQTYDQRHTYSTRHSNNLVGIQCKTAHYFNSCIPSCARLWNELPTNVKQSPSLNSFKESLSKLDNLIPVPKYYNTKNRRGQILHARLRMRCSSLKQHLFLSNIEPDPYCTCGRIESNAHYLLECTKYTDLRRDMFNNIGLPVTCNLLLYGDSNKTLSFNQQIFTCVEKFILHSKRF